MISTLVRKTGKDMQQPKNNANYKHTNNLSAACIYILIEVCDSFSTAHWAYSFHQEIMLCCDVKFPCCALFLPAPTEHQTYYFQVRITHQSCERSSLVKIVSSSKERGNRLILSCDILFYLAITCAGVLIVIVFKCIFIIVIRSSWFENDKYCLSKLVLDIIDVWEIFMDEMWRSGKNTPSW